MKKIEKPVENQSEARNEATDKPQPARRPKFPKIKTRVKAGKPWRRY